MAYNVLFAGCARNCEPYLDQIEENLLSISTIFGTADLLVFENDSTDNTKQRLSSFLSSIRSRRIIHADGLTHSLPSRTLRLAYGRNAIADAIRTPLYEHVDLVILLDFDEVNTEAPRLDVIKQTVEEMHADEKWGASFANTLGIYYDLWALRHPQLCPGDVWLDAETYRITTNKSIEEAFSTTFANRAFSIPETLAPIEVESAFGGFGIYKSFLFRDTKARYIGEQSHYITVDGKDKLIHYQLCEHVSFHTMIRSTTGCKLKIVPSLINRTVPAPSFNPLAMSSLKINEYPIN